MRVCALGCAWEWVRSVRVRGRGSVGSECVCEVSV